MKRSIITIAIFTISAIAALVSAAPVEVPDTLLQARKPMRAVVTQNGDSLSVVIVDKDGMVSSFTQYDEDTGNAPTEKAAATPWLQTGLPFVFPADCGCNDGDGERVQGVMSGVGFGLSMAYGAPADWGLRMGKSLQITWPMILGIRVRLARSTWATVGVGVGWRNYKANGLLQMVPNGQGGVGVAPYPDHGVSDPMNSRLKIFSLQFPVVFTQSLGFKLPCGVKPRLSLGAILNWNSHASLCTAFRDDKGNVVHQSYEGLHQRKFTVDPYASISCGTLSLYVQYSPMNILEGHGSPKIHPLTVGIGLSMP